MEATQAQRQHPEDKPHKLVPVSVISVNEETGDQVEESKEIPKGKTEVAKLKEELNVPAELALWVIDKHGKRVRLADHATHDVKKDDRFVVIRPGGVS